MDDFEDYYRLGSRLVATFIMQNRTPPTNGSM